MNSGLEAFPLAFFTTLAPAGIVAFIVLALTRFFSKEPATQTRIDRYIALPFAAALLGFIASATHLGTPANALHVFAGVGRSPLSNEVLAAVIFLLFAGSYWMAAFRKNFPQKLAHLWLALTSIAGIAALRETALAYSVSTVPTWDTWHVPVNLVLSALSFGSLLGVMLLEVAHTRPRQLELGLVALGACAFIANSITMFLQNTSLQAIANNEFSALQISPYYGVIIVAFLLLGSLGYLLGFISLKKGQAPRLTLILRSAASLLLFCSVLIARLGFYSLHMTIGF